MFATMGSTACHKPRPRVEVHFTGEGDLGTEAHYHSSLIIPAPHA